MNTTAIPDGFKQDAQGRLVPVSAIRPIDMTRDQLVQEIVQQAKGLSAEIHRMKNQFFDDIAAFVTLSAEEYSVKLGGEKGNVSLVSFDGRYKVERAIQEGIAFDERLQAAKALIDSCLNRWSQGAQPEIKVLINDAFQVDRAGNINTNRVLGLRRLAIADDEWQSAMKAIGEAIQVSGSKSYVRIYERNAIGAWVAIPLDMARV